MARRARLGVSILEVLIAAVIGAILGLSAYTLILTGRHEAHASEDTMFAEALAQRYLAEIMAIPQDELESRMPFSISIGGVPDEDRAIAADRPDYARNLGGPESFRGEATAELARPGLTLYRVSITWPVRPGSKARRQYGLVRLRCRKDIAISENPLRKADPGGVP